MYVCKDSAAPAHARTRAQARGATPELRRVTDTTSHGLSAGRHSTQTTIGSPILCDRPRGGGGIMSISYNKRRRHTYVHIHARENHDRPHATHIPGPITMTSRPLAGRNTAPRPTNISFRFRCTRQCRLISFECMLVATTAPRRAAHLLFEKRRQVVSTPPIPSRLVWVACDLVPLPVGHRDEPPAKNL